MFGSIFGSVAGSVLGSVTSSLLGGGGGGGSSSGGSGFSMTDLIGPALQVGGSLLGGKLQNDSNEEINAHNLRLAQDQIEWQRQYAHNRLQWQVEDAKKAGLHPMVAAGLSPVSFSPVSANLTPNNYDWVGQAGQSLNYAATKAKTRNQQGQMLDLQLQGLMLDNQYKQAQIDALKVDTLAATIASDQALNSPAAPDLDGGNNLIGGQNDSPSYSPDSPYGKDLFTLFTLARHGDTLYEVPHPDIADSITETEWKNILSSIDAELQAETGVIKPPVYKLTPHERKLVREHKAELVRIPGVGWKLDRNPSRPHPLANLSKYERFNRRNTQRWKGKQEVSGPIF